MAASFAAGRRPGRMPFYAVVSAKSINIHVGFLETGGVGSTLD
jgi:hypothetical protein